MATWPSGTKASTANVDQGTDSPSSARSDIKQALDNQSAIIDMFNIASPSNLDILKYNTTNTRFELSSDYATSAQGALADSALQNLVEDTTPQLGGNLDLQANEITTSVVDGGITLRANGGGIIEAISDGFIIGDGVSAASLTTNGATNIVIDTNDGVDTGSITIATGVNGDITLAPNGTGTVIITGNLQIDGTTTTVNSTTLDVDDINITLAKGAANAAAANGGGITVEGPTTAATITYASSDDSWNLNKKTSAIELQIDNINVNGNSITSTDTNGNITVTPNGTGSIVLDGQSWPQAAPATNDQYLQGNADGTLAWTDRVNAKTIYETVKNTSGGSLAKGTPVYQSGITGLTITVGAARADDVTKLAIGVLDETLADQAEGRMLVLGEIKGVSTTGFTTGDKIYLGETGGYTNVAPTGTAVARQFLGIVNRVDASNGSGYITGTLVEDSVKWTGTEFQFWDGDSWVSLPSSIAELVEDTTPQLGGNLDVNGNSIVSVSNGNISITPNGTGKTIVSRLNYNEGIYEIGTGQSGTITPDASNGNLQYIEISGNITINGLNNPVAGQAVTIVIDSLGAYTLTSSMLFAGGDKTLTDTGVDILSILYLGNSTYLASLNKDFS